MPQTGGGRGKKTTIKFVGCQWLDLGIRFPLIMANIVKITQLFVVFFPCNQVLR